jgi:hypothetical protein
MTGTQIEIVGWRYEVYSEMLDTWRTVTTFTQTGPEIRNRVPRIRGLTPLVAYNTVIAATRQPADAAATDGRRRTAEAIDRRPHAVVAARNGHAGDQGEDHE